MFVKSPGKTVRSAVVLTAIASVLLSSILPLHLTAAGGVVLSVAAAAGKGNGGGNGGDSGKGGSGGNGGGSQGGGGNSGGNGGGNSGGGNGGGNGNSGNGGNSGGSGNSGSSSGHSSGKADDNSAVSSGTSLGKSGVRVDVGASSISVRHSNGIIERIVRGRYEMRDARARLIVSRKATSTDLARLRSFAR